MKINQTQTQLELKTSGLSQAITGIILIIVGIIVAVAVLNGAIKIEGGKALPMWAALAGLVFVVAGILSAFFARNRDIILQKGGTSTVTSKRFFGGQPQNTTFDTNKVVAVSLSTHLTRDNNMDSNTGSHSSTHRHSELSLVLDDNSMISIASSGGSGGSFSFGMSNFITKAPLGKESEQIATYLGIPLQSSGMFNPISDIKSVVDTIHDSASQIQPQPSPNQTVQPVIPSQQTAGFTAIINQTDQINPTPAVPVQPTTPPDEITLPPRTPQ